MSFPPRRVLAVVLAGITAFMNIYGLQSLLPTLAHSFGASHAAVSLTLSATTLAVALGSPGAGLLGTRLTRRRQMSLAVGGLTVCGVGGALAPTLGWLLLWRFGLGLSLPLLVTAVMGMIAHEWPDSYLGRGTSLYVASTVFGGFIGRFFTGVLGAQVGWRAAMFGLAVLNALVGWLLLSQVRDQRASATPPRLGEFLRALRTPGVAPSLCIGFQILFCLVGLFTYVTFHLAGKPFNLGPAALGSLSAVYLVGGCVTPLAGRLFARMGENRALTLASSIGALGALATLIPHLGAVIVGLILCSTASFVCQAATTGVVSRQGKECRAAAMACYLSAYYFGGCAGAALPGLCWGWGGWTACVLLFTAAQLSIGYTARRLP